MSNSLEAQASSGYILFWELCDVKILYVVFDSITSFLVANDHTLENTAEGRDSTTLMFWNAGQIRLYFRTKSLLHGQAKDVIQPVVAFNLDFCAVTKDELLPRKVVVVAKVLPIDDGILELFGLSNFVWSGEIDTLRDHDDRGHIVLEDKTMDAVEDGLPSDGVFGNVVVICLDTGEHSTEVPRRDLGLESLDYLASCLLARDRVIPTVLLAKDNVDYAKGLDRCESQERFEGPICFETQGFCERNMSSLKLLDAQTEGARRRAVPFRHHLRPCSVSPILHLRPRHCLQKIAVVGTDQLCLNLSLCKT